MVICDATYRYNYMNNLYLLGEIIYAMSMAKKEINKKGWGEESGSRTQMNTPQQLLQPQGAKQNKTMTSETQTKTHRHHRLNTKPIK